LCGSEAGEDAAQKGNNPWRDGLLPIMPDNEHRTSPRPTYPAEKARGGDIILRRPWQRAVFIVGLAAPVILLALLLLWRSW
jgi:hypothetical protein